MGYELDRTTMEAGRNAAEDEYFEARPQIDCNDRRKVFDAGYERGWEERNRQVMALQAKLDEVMLEYCPDEMTDDQRSEWARHQQPVSEQEQQTIEAVLGLTANAEASRPREAAKENAPPAPGRLG